MPGKILSPHYRGRPSVPEVRLFDKPQPSKSVLHSVPLGTFSYKFGEGPTHYVKDGKANFRTSNNLFSFSLRDFNEYGNFFNNDDRGMRGWNFAGQDNYASRHDLIPKMPDVALIQSPRLGMYFPNPRDTQVNLRTSHDIVNAVHPNRLGYNLSKIPYQVIRNSIFDNVNRLNNEAVEYIDFLGEKGFSIETAKTAGILGLGVKRGRFLAAYYPGQGYLVAGTNFHEIAKSLISKYGLTNAEAIEAMKRSVLFHEIGHVLGIPGDRESEELQGLLQAEFYSMMAERHKGKLGRIYRALAQEGSDYARLYSRKWGQIEYEDNSIDLLVAKFEAEADALELEGTIKTEHINERLNETVGAIYRVKPSHRKSSRENKKYSNGKGLEAVVDESFVIVKNRSRVADYEGYTVYGEGDSVELAVKDKEVESENADAKETSEAA